MTDRVVLDASVLSKAYLKDEQHADRATAILSQFVSGQLDVVVPEYALYEVPSAILNGVRRRRLDARQGLASIREFFRMGVPTVGHQAGAQSLIERAYHIAQVFGCRLYDGLYITISDELDIPLVTADAKLYRGLRHRLANLTWIEDYPTAP